MPLFQQSVLRKYVSELNKENLSAAWKTFQSHFHNPSMQAHIRQLKEEQYQEGFLRDLFVTVFGYTLNPQPGFNLTTEHKNEKDNKKADGAILKTGAVRAVIELKGTDTTDLSKIEGQAFGYLHNQKGCTYVITSNFEKLRFYIQDATDFLEFSLFTLGKDEFDLLYICLQADNLLSDVPLQVKQQSVTQEDAITKKLYADYSTFKQALYQDLVAKNPLHDKIELFKKTQKLLDRFLFILFAEDRLLLPPNFIVKIVEEHRQVLKLRLQQSLYDRFRVYFNDLLTGNKDEEIFAYNGGLFEPDDVLDSLAIADEVLQQGVLRLSQYDYNTEVDVNILGHIFEHSLNEIEELQASLEQSAVDKTKTRRKKEGVFYTPRYITKYIVENTIGALCQEKKEALQIVEEDYAPAVKKTKASEAQRKALVQKLDEYRSWLLDLTICDPACGSGAFLNAALEFLITEHNYVDELTNKLMGASIGFTWTPNDILEHNLFGVDINEEAVEIARLSLWLRTAQKGRKLSNLSSNIKTGNSLVEDKAVAGEIAFVWKEEFKEVFKKGGFDVVIGNPPYVPTELINALDKKYLEATYQSAYGRINLFPIFYEKAIKLSHLNSRIGLITPYTILKNQYYVEARKFILQWTYVESIIDFKDKVVFQDAAVDSIVMILQVSEEKNSSIVIIDQVEDLSSNLYRQRKLNQQIFESKKDYAFELNSNLIDESKFLNNTDKLQDVLDFNQGIITGDNKKFITVSAGLNNKKVITGSDFNRYSLGWGGQYVVYDTSSLHRPRKVEIFEVEKKILLRQTASYPIATYDDSKFYTLDTVHNRILKDSHYSLKYLLCLINSTFFRFLYVNSINEEGKVFAQVKIIYVNPLPLKRVDDAAQQPFIAKADTMLSKNKELQTLKQSLLQFLLAKNEGISVSKKLADWPSIGFNEFLRELNKQKIKLSLAEQAEWLSYFEGEKAKAADIQQLIDKTDKEIDAMVYQLYGLTKEEIAIVETASNTKEVVAS